jgi:hypothetical protein
MLTQDQQDQTHLGHMASLCAYSRDEELEDQTWTY